MTFKLVDRVRETSISPGTGTAVLAGAALGYQTFSAGVGANNTTYYVIADQSGANWEVGYGTVGALGTTLARTTVLSSSNAGSLVNFTSGTQDVWVDYPATKAVFQDSTGTVSVPVLLTTSTTSTTPNLSFNASNTPLSAGASISGSYLQAVLQNKSGTAGASTNYVLSNDLGTDSTYYGEFGMNSSVFSASTPTDFFSINNGVYFSGHDGDITVGSGNGFKTYLAWGTTGQSAHVINASGALGFSTNLGTTPALSGTTGYGTAGQVLTSGGSAAAPTWTTPTTGTVTSVSALTLGTTGTDLSSTVANGTTTPVITLNVPTASASNRGALSSTDWSTFNGKQAALVSGTNIKTVGGVSLLGSGDVGTIGVGYGGTGLTSLTAGRVPFGAGTSAINSSSNLFWDNTNKVLGIGTSSPVLGTTSYAGLDLEGAAGGMVVMGTSGTQQACIYGNAGGLTLQSLLAGYGVSFYTNSTRLALLDSNGNFSLTVGGSQLRSYAAGYAPLLADSSGNTIAARAWVNFDGTVSTPTIRASFNVSSVVRNDVGSYTINFTNAMPDTSFVATGSTIDSQETGSGYLTCSPQSGTTRTTSSVGITTRAAGQSRIDTSWVQVLIFR